MWHVTIKIWNVRHIYYSVILCLVRFADESFVSFLLVLVSGKALALSTLNYSSSSPPIVTLPYGSFQRKVVGDLVEYLGIPFAAPPYVNAARQTRITCMLVQYWWTSIWAPKTSSIFDQQTGQDTVLQSSKYIYSQNLGLNTSSSKVVTNSGMTLQRIDKD